MNALYDIHCHLIPGVDDGSINIEESLNAVKAEYDEGVRTIICTSHISIEQDSSYSQLLYKQMQVLQEALKGWEHGNQMELHMGNELFYSDSILDKLRLNEAYSMAGSHYVLTEFHPSVRYDELYHGLRSLASGGWLPILAHMERYDCLLKQKERLEELANLGVYLQVNTSTLLGRLLDSRSAFVKKLVQEGKIHFLGTDSHGMHYRQPKIRAAAQWIEKHCKESVSDRILYENPKAVLEDKII